MAKVSDGLEALDIDLDIPGLSEGVVDASEDFYFDLTGVEEGIAEFVKGVDELDTLFPPADFEKDLAAFADDLDYLEKIL